MPKISRKDERAKIEKSKKHQQSYKENMKKALEIVMSGQMKLRQAAETCGVSKSALHRVIIKYRETDEENRGQFDFERKHGFRQIFEDTEEKMLADYLTKACQMCYGLTVRGTCEFVYQFAVANNKNIPQSWHTNRKAGVEWIRLFRKRQPQLALRTPEATSLSRATSFNKHNVKTFFENLQSVIVKYGFDMNQIYNCDETAVTTVHKPPKIIATVGQKQVGKVTSSERGVLVTMCAAICANGQYIPPFFVFPRKNFKPHMIHGAPPGSKGTAYPSGWMTAENFLKFTEHLVEISRCSVDNKILLILDNHESHCDIRVLNYCKQNGVVLLTLPPHCSHKLQPLDVACFGPFKAYYNRAMDDWLLNHPGTPLTIYNIAELTGSAFPQALVPCNIIKGFQRTGISPYNPGVFTDVDYLSSYVTDRPYTEDDKNCSSSSLSRNNDENDVEESSTLKRFGQSEKTPPPTVSNEFQPTEAILPRHPGDSKDKGPSKIIFSPEEIRPHLKAQKRLATRKTRSKAQSTIMTDTPNIDDRKKKEYEKIEKYKCMQQRKNKARLSVKKKIVTDSSSESDIEEDILCDDDSLDDVSDSEKRNYETDLEYKVTDFILVQYPLKKSIRHYVGQIDRIDQDEYSVNFLRKTSDLKFIFPERRDQDIVNSVDIVCKLPGATLFGGTERAVKQLTFKFDFTPYNIQ